MGLKPPNGTEYMERCVYYNGCLHVDRCMAEQHCCASNADVLNVVADRVLAHKPKPKSKPARKRARRAKKLQAADV